MRSGMQLTATLHSPLSARPRWRSGDITSDKFARQISIQTDKVTGAVSQDNYFDCLRAANDRLRILDRAVAIG